MVKLGEITERLLAHLRATSGDKIEVAHDFYWAVPPASAYDSYAKPTDLDVGQLEDDWSQLLRIANDEADPIGYALVWLGQVLRVIGEENVA